METFHKWKNKQIKKDGFKRDRFWYYQKYGNYIKMTKNNSYTDASYYQSGLDYDDFEKPSFKQKELDPKPIIHTCKDGRQVCLNYHNPYGRNIPRMEDSHLLNTIKFVQKRAKEGITIRMGGGVDVEDIWYDEETIYGKEAKEKLGLEKYIKEAQNRKLI